MAEQEDHDYQADMARWLQDSGRRHAARQADTPEEILRHIEKLSGRAFRSTEDVAAYFLDLKAQEAERIRAETRRRFVRDSVFLGVLTVSAAQYYFLDVLLQIETLHRVYYFVDPQPPVKRSS